MKTTVPTLESNIAALTGVDEQRIRSIILAIKAGDPTNIEQARAICDSDFTSDEQERAAHEKWAELSKAQIETATHYKATTTALQNCDPTNAALLKQAVEKAIALHKEVGQLKMIFHEWRGDIRAEVKEELGTLVRTALRAYVVDMKSALYMWSDFVGHEIDEAWLLKEMEGYFKAMRTDEKKEQLLRKLHEELPKSHPMRFEVFTAWANCHSDPDDLRKIHANFAKALETEEETARRQGHSYNDKIGKVWTDYLQKVISDLVRRLDDASIAAVHNIDSETALLAEFEKARLPQLNGTKLAIIVKLKAIWNKKLVEELPFSVARDLFSSMLSVLDIHKENVMVRQAWQAMAKKSKSKEDAGQMIEAAIHTKYRNDAIDVWLGFEHSFEELVAMHHKVNGDHAALDAAVIAKADTFAKAKRTMSISWSDKSKFLAIENMATKIDGLINGMVALDLIRNNVNKTRGENIPVVKKVLEFVTSEDELHMAAKYLDGYQHDQVKRLLVEKALALIGEEQPTTA
jgi:hypothetical protein